MRNICSDAAKKDDNSERLENKLKEMEILNASLAGKIESIRKAEEKKLKCMKCDFTSGSEQGLKTHLKRKHKEQNKEKEPFPL